MGQRAFGFATKSRTQGRDWPTLAVRLPSIDKCIASMNQISK
jgi:hypothetical protein